MPWKADLFKGHFAPASLITQPCKRPHSSLITSVWPYFQIHSAVYAGGMTLIYLMSSQLGQKGRGNPQKQLLTGRI